LCWIDFSAKLDLTTQKARAGGCGLIMDDIERRKRVGLRGNGRPLDYIGRPCAAEQMMRIGIIRRLREL